MRFSVSNCITRKLATILLYGAIRRLKSKSFKQLEDFIIDSTLGQKNFNLKIRLESSMSAISYLLTTF